MILSLLITCAAHPILISTLNLPTKFSPGSMNQNGDISGVRPFIINPQPSPAPSPTDNDPAAASSLIPSLPSIAPSDTASIPANSTADSFQDLPLNVTELENPDLVNDVLQFDKDDASQNNSSNAFNYRVHCWSVHDIWPIADPDDCASAEQLLFEEGKPLMPLVWTEPRAWTAGSCSILLVGRRPSASDIFTLLDIVYAVDSIRRQCVTGGRGFRGGEKGIGPQDLFYVAVEANHHY